MVHNGFLWIYGIQGFNRDGDTERERERERERREKTFF